MSELLPPSRHVPVRPNLDQLKHQAKDLLRELHQAEPAALAEFAKYHPEKPDPATAKLADAQFALARSYGVASWPRLVLACRIIDAIWEDDFDVVQELVTQHPELLHEDARGVKGNWGPPMSYAANVGRDRIIDMLRDRGAQDVQFAFGRACLQGKLDTARKLHAMGARPGPGEVMGPCETQNGKGLALLLELGARFEDDKGDRLAPVGLILETYCRNPTGKHECLELAAAQGIELPDTPPMALHRGRIDLLEAHLRRDPQMLSRRYTHEEIYPPSLGCHADHTLALCGTPLAGTTLLHQTVDYNEIEIARWLIEQGADVNAASTIDPDGFGGHTPLFGCVVSQPYRVGRRKDADFARLLLDHGADPNARASLRKRLRFVEDETEHTYRDVSILEWGERFHDQDWVSKSVMELVRERGGYV